MGKNKNTPNLYCPVPGCKAKTPHASDRTVSDLVKILGDPIRLTELACKGMSQLIISMRQDWDGKREFAWFCRIRQTEELFYKTLYAVFFAPTKELHHMMSGEYPNSLLPYYETVNKELYAGRGKLTEELPGLPPYSVLNTPLGLLHSGAHTAFSALITGYAFATNPTLQPYPEQLHSKIQTNVDRLDWVHRLFAAGIDKNSVLDKYKNDRTWRDELARSKRECVRL